MARIISRSLSKQFSIRIKIWIWIFRFALGSLGFWLFSFDKQIISGKMRKCKLRPFADTDRCLCLCLWPYLFELWEYILVWRCRHRVKARRKQCPSILRLHKYEYEYLTEQCQNLIWIPSPGTFFMTSLAGNCRQELPLAKLIKISISRTLEKEENVNSRGERLRAVIINNTKY